MGIGRLSGSLGVIREAEIMGDKAASEGFPAGASGVSAVGAGAARRGGAQAWDRHARDQAPRLAPGQPGSPSHWCASDKDGVGTAITPTDSATSLVWFTLGHGILNEIFYPRMDEACTRDLEVRP
ncbi:MAG TPA: hypothetical protein VKP69_17975 [Isosphaeraceae bacterium]|nr:hypothetical protein [Isosphaeraceae bacterium]